MIERTHTALRTQDPFLNQGKQPRRLKTVVIPLEHARVGGGMLHSVELLIRHMSQVVDCIAVVPEGSPTAPIMSVAGAGIVETPNLPVWPLTKRAPIESWTAVRKVREVLRGILDEQSLLLTNNIGSELICGLGAPFPSTPRVYVNRGNEYGGISLRMLRSSLKNVRAVVATTPYQEQVAIQRMHVTPERVAIIPNAVDEQLLDLTSTPLPSWSREGRVNIGVVGRPAPGKNQELLVRAMSLLSKRHHDVCAHIIGSPGSTTNERYIELLERIVDELGLQNSVQFVPYEADKCVLYAGIDILVSTSKREGFGRTIIEAMAAGKPVVALRAGGPECLIEHDRTGILIDSNDPAALASALERIISDPPFASTMSKRAQAEAVSRYTATNVAQQYLALLVRSYGVCS